LGERTETAWHDLKDGAETVSGETSNAMDKIAVRFK